MIKSVYDAMPEGGDPIAYAALAAQLSGVHQKDLDTCLDYLLLCSEIAIDFDARAFRRARDDDAIVTLAVPDARLTVRQMQLQTLPVATQAKRRTR